MEEIINGANIHYETRGEGEPILFVHGFPLDGTMWHDVAGRLSNRWCSIIPDLRGHGRSPVTNGISMTLYADDQAALLNHLREWRPAVVVGLSMGGYVAFEFFRRHRRLLRALVLADTRANADNAEAAARREATAQMVLREGCRGIADSMATQLFAPGAAPQIRSHWHDKIAGASPEGVAAAARALAARADCTPLLAQIDCPTLITVGAEDAITPPALSREMNAAIRNSRLVTIPNAGHMPPVEQPAAFAAELQSFLNSLPTA